VARLYAADEATLWRLGTALETRLRALVFVASPNRFGRGIGAGYRLAAQKGLRGRGGVAGPPAGGDFSRGGWGQIRLALGFICEII
jgi:hypothetical protein